MRLLLLILSGVLLGLSYPPIPTGVPALFALIPLFIVLSSVGSIFGSVKNAYISFLVFNVLTLYWTGGFVHGKDIYMMVAGGLLLLVHPLFFCLPIIGCVFIRRWLGDKWALISFPFVWVAFEYMHASSQVGFPWLTLGNTQTYDLAIIQIASITGVYGISFWILVINVLGFILLVNLATNRWKNFSWKSMTLTGLIVVMYILPKIYGGFAFTRPPVANNTLKIAIIQPNIDPFEKWEGSASSQLTVLQRMTDSIAVHQPDLILWPETAVPFYVLHPGNREYLQQVRSQVDRNRIPLLTGIPDITFHKSADSTTGNSKRSADGEFYNTYNGSMLLVPGSDEIQRYSKIILVPFAEHVPFSEYLGFLNAAQWNFGMGGWSIGPDSTVFRFDTKANVEVKLSNLICYESIYPGFVAQFVKKGAQFLTVITNDSWWGNTSGAYQHVQFGVIRAVENRRWVVQCANGGISAFIDPLGRIRQQTSLYEQTTLVSTVELLDELTYYSRHGDWFAQGALACALSILGVSVFRRFILRKV